MLLSAPMTTRPWLRLAVVFALSLGAGSAGCAADTETSLDAPNEGAGEEGLSESQDELRGEAVAAGTELRTTVAVNFRTGPGTSYGRITVLAAGRGLVATGRSQNAFYEVTAGGNTGWVHGAYLVVVTGDSPAEVPTVPGQIVDSFVSDGTGYYPSSSALEGGFNDRRGTPLKTLQQYLAGNADYVSVAMDTNAFVYGTKLRITEFEQRYGRPIEFRVVDTGGAFRGKGRSRMDICVQNYNASLDPTVNGRLHVQVVR